MQGFSVQNRMAGSKLGSYQYLLIIGFEAMKNVLNLVSLSASLLLAFLVMIATSLQAQSMQAEEPMALRHIMESLGHDMQAVTAAISIEDWVEVADLAPKIGKHPEPPIEEKKRILSWLGADAGEFRGLDMQVQEAATTMEEAAKRGDGKEVIAAFSKAQLHCLACHESFRRPFIKQFYQTP